MFERFIEWLGVKWQARAPSELVNAYHAAFMSAPGRLVLQDLLDSVYCTIYEGNDPVTLAAHNGRRSVVHEILENIDIAENPDRYKQKEPEDAS